MEDALQYFSKIVQDVTGRTNLEIKESTDLIGEEILDSLDWSVFLLDIEKHFGVKIPDDDVESKNLSIAGNLIDFIKAQ